ncbi:Hypothetical predicted protein [Podarcis lilfordi]|uniref:Uncharacterized protein n=1 Tax=Podarcis lilfordi TaxID=74358 RepID=A0AA35L9L4_9SAUR|nr:Hypothetical predicted protein [Podarcis lilfordi]
MGLWRSSLFFLAWILATPAHSRRQRVSELGPDQGEPQEEACSLGIGGGWLASDDCTLPLLLVLSGALALIYVFLFKGQRDWAAALKNRFYSLARFLPCCLKDGSLPHFFRGVSKGAEAAADQDARLDESLLREVSSILQVIRHRLWEVVQDRRKQRSPKRRASER